MSEDTVQTTAHEVPFRLFASARKERKPSVDMMQVVGACIKSIWIMAKATGAREFYVSFASCDVCRISTLSVRGKKRDGQGTFIFSQSDWSWK